MWVRKDLWEPEVNLPRQRDTVLYVAYGRDWPIVRTQLTMFQPGVWVQLVVPLDERVRAMQFIGFDVHYLIESSPRLADWLSEMSERIRLTRQGLWNEIKEQKGK